VPTFMMVIVRTALTGRGRSIELI